MPLYYLTWLILSQRASITKSDKTVYLDAIMSAHISHGLMFISWILNSRIEPIAANKSILILEAYHNPQIGYTLGAMELALHRDDQQIIF